MHIPRLPLCLTTLKIHAFFSHVVLNENVLYSILAYSPEGNAMEIGNFSISYFSHLLEGIFCPQLNISPMKQPSVADFSQWDQGRRLSKYLVRRIRNSSLNQMQLWLQFFLL